MDFDFDYVWAEYFGAAKLYVESYHCFLAKQLECCDFFSNYRIHPVFVGGHTNDLIAAYYFYDAFLHRDHAELDNNINLGSSRIRHTSTTEYSSSTGRSCASLVHTMAEFDKDAHAAAPAKGSLQPVRAGLSGGAIAGVVMGTLVGLAALAAAILFFLLRRRGNNAGGDAESPKPSNPQRNPSVVSRTGLLSQDKLDPLIIPATWRHSNTTYLDPDGISPMDEKRLSKPLVYDQRLNPSALLQHDNGSRTSVGTMQDHRDYARPLKAMNPDPLDAE
ncbi:hypothetical protein B0A49_02249 [Cryomyces minteri]|uniref:Uncharacterized protein n=1 Tax=Cryomyces minteri TaxID=331657 RepID=A0A4U0XN08_9PEZI|nr:hypothetical protein B0A49_02249 [Cryomyces minteri]